MKKNRSPNRALEIFKTVSKSCKMWLHIVFFVNLSLSSGVFPSQLKNAIISPILKKKSLDPDCLSHYRPVSNIPFVAKLVEKAVSKQYLAHLEINCVNNTFQSAYKAHHSTETALVRVQNDVLQAVDRKGGVILVLLDLSAAFDIIDHELLLCMLERQMGVTGTALAWFRSYLSGRTQSVHVNRKSSANHPLKYGVSQGSVLGPILFTTYTQPLHMVQADTNFKCCMLMMTSCIWPFNLTVQAPPTTPSHLLRTAFPG